MLKSGSEAMAMNWLYNKLVTEILAPASESEAKRSHDT